ncbi:MAG: Glu-tRNA(Gln) amidotransferase subunit GatD, partial [Candidatus Diapherotrites archaeon]|nr:Glu-tRNA(Gln) amidotransferase subunit GatD [Candidatus Diapherotrites archaeon]
KKIAGAVANEIKQGTRGIIIGHGTDTLAYTSAALSFMLENLNVPVILVGAQRSSDRGSSDAAMNLLCAAEFIAKTDFVGVAICMHDASDDGCCAILPATKTRKMHTSRRDAFRAINDTAIARINYKTKEIGFLKKDYAKRNANAKLALRDGFEDKVGLIKTHPNMHAAEFEFYKKQKYSGLVIEGTGLGHMPVGISEENLKIRKALQSLIKSGCVVAMAPQCLYGRVHPTVYTNLRILSGMGVIFCEDMLPETAFIKLAWLLGNYGKEKAKKLLAQNLRGEITPRTEFETFDLEGA